MWRHRTGCLLVECCGSGASLVLALRIACEGWGSTSNPSLNVNLHYPTDIDRTLNESSADKVLQYRAHFSNCPSHAIAFMTVIGSTSGRLHGKFVRLLFLQSFIFAFYFYRLIGKLTDFLQVQEFR